MTVELSGIAIGITVVASSRRWLFPIGSYMSTSSGESSDRPSQPRDTADMLSFTRLYVLHIFSFCRVCYL